MPGPIVFLGRGDSPVLGYRLILRPTVIGQWPDRIVNLQPGDIVAQREVALDDDDTLALRGRCAGSS